MAIPRGESGARLDTEAGRAAEAAFQQRKAAEAAQAAMRVAQAEAEAGRAAAAQAAMAAAAAAAQRAAPVVQQAVQAHSAQIVAAVPAAAPPAPGPSVSRPAPIRDTPSSVTQSESDRKGDFITEQIGDRRSGIDTIAQSAGPGPYNGSSATDPRISELERQLQELRNRLLQDENLRQEQQRQAREAAGAWLKNLLAQYGMGEMAGSVDALIQEWGPNTEVIALKLKDTQQYKDRFKGLLALRAKGVTDIANEGEYIRQESLYREVFREAGIQSYIGDAGSTTERDAIARLIGDYSVSVNEVRARVQDAQRVVADTAPEVRDALQRYYNVSASDLVAFTLDPSRAKNRINEIANAAMIGGYAQRAGLNADRSTAEQIASLSGANDAQLQALTPQLGVARQVADATQRLASIESTDLTDSEILLSEFDLDQGAERKIKGLQSRERARFSGRSAMTTGTLSRNSGV